jgi:hypothetical protein
MLARDAPVGSRHGHPRKTEAGERAEIPAYEGVRVLRDRVRLHDERDSRDDQRAS